MTRSRPDSPSFSELTADLAATFDSLGSRSIVMFGGKGGVGKTTLASLAAVRIAASRPTLLLTTDPASNLVGPGSIVRRSAGRNLEVEQLDADALYRRFLGKNLESFLELGDRGTYLDREEIARFFELSLPGIDELMGWMRIGEIAEERPGTMLVVDTAPTGHTLRMLSSPIHFDRLANALEAMQSKHRELVEQLTRRRVRDAMDAFVDDFRSTATARESILKDPRSSAFVPVLLSQEWVVAQTRRLIEEVRGQGIDVPLAILNRAAAACDCTRCEEERDRDLTAIAALDPLRAVRAPRSCAPLDSRPALLLYLDGRQRKPARSGASIDREPPPVPQQQAVPLAIPPAVKLLFFAGKGGVGKTTAASSVALQLAASNPAKKLTLISVDPAHSIRDVFAVERPPANLTVETVDTKTKWDKLRSELGAEVERAIGGLMPTGLSLAHDQEVMRELVDIGPPGADEIFAVIRLHELLMDDAVDLVLVDTAPTGHFLRLLSLPATAGEWVREFMRILLHYRELIPPGALGEELLNASRALTAFSKALESDAAAAVVITRPETAVIDETLDLLEALRRNRLGLAGTVVNAVTPVTGCRCDDIARTFELDCAAALQPPLTLVPRKDAPVVSLADLRNLIPIAQTART